MESAGKQILDDKVREAMKDGGLGTPATRAETIEKLIKVNYLERIGKSLRATSKARLAIRLLGDSDLTSAELTGRWEQRLGAIEHGEEHRVDFMSDIRQFTLDLVEYFRKISSEDVRALWSIVGRCPADDGDVRENRKAYGCSSRVSPEEPGCGFVIWKTIKGRSISPGEARVLTESGATPFLDGSERNPAVGGS